MAIARRRIVVLLILLVVLVSSLALQLTGRFNLARLFAPRPTEFVFVHDRAEQVLPTFRTVAPKPTELDRRYRTPLRVAVDQQNERLYVSATNARSVVVVDMSSGRVVDELAAQDYPNGLALSPDGRTLYVANRYSDTVTVIDLASGRTVCHVAVDNQPCDVVTHPVTGAVYVSCLGRDESICVIDPGSNRVVARTRVPDNPRHLALSPDGETLAVTCDAPGLERYVVLLDADGLATRQVIPVQPAANLRGVVFLDKRTIAFAYSIPRPDVHAAGEPAPWNHAVGLIRLGAQPEVRTLVLDTEQRYYANPYDLALTRDPAGRSWLAVSCGAADRVLLIDVAWLLARFDRLPPASTAPGPRAATDGETIRYVQTGPHPQGLAASGEWLYIVERLNDSVAALRTAGESEVTRRFTIGPAERSRLREGEIMFNSAMFCYRNQFACATCHPEGHNARLAWDLADDGVGTFKDIKSLRGIAGTSPFRWQGEARTVGQDECLPTIEQVMRGGKPLPDELAKLEAYVLSIPHVPNPFRKPNGELTKKALRGKEIFEGDYIAGCTKCHFPHDEVLIVRRAPGTGKGRPDVLVLPNGDRIQPDEYDVPHLTGTWDDGPWLHDGRAKTLADAVYMHNAEEHAHIKGEDMEALVEYLSSL